MIVTAGKTEVLCQELEPLAGLRIVESDGTQGRLEVLAGVEFGEDDRLVADVSSAAIHGTRVATLSLQVRPASGDEEAAGRMKSKESLEIQVSPIHDLEGSGFRQQLVEDVDVVHLAVDDVDKCRDNAAQIERRVQPHGGLRRAKRRPARRPSRSDPRKRLVDVELASHRNQAMHERRIDTPLAHRVRICERSARNPTVALRPEACLDVPAALAAGELRAGQAEKLLETRQALDLVLATVRDHAETKHRERQMARQLCKNQLARVHRRDPQKGSSRSRTGACRSRDRKTTRVSPRESSC